MLTLLMLACTPAVEGTPPSPLPAGPASLRGEPIAFADWFAPEVLLSAAQPGAYRAALDHRFDGMISMERTFSRWAKAETALTIAEDGTAHGCTTGKQGSRSSESRFVSEDGEHHVRTSDYEFSWGFRGRWERSGGWLLIWVEALAVQGCEVDENAFSQELDGLLMCAQATLPGVEEAGLVCHPVGSVVSSPLREYAALPIGRALGGEQGPGMDWSGQEWLVLGGGEGLSISWRYRDRDEVPTVELAVP